mmetsp:Transcript_59255/g.152505  ORF Transcript_59255/g.152505 Transcript_59255/m.152505 type:complete len:595 (-) Transcript_59255:110-1894(-)
MVENSDKPVWYRIYVLLVLLLVHVCSLATRNLPSYLITVPVPDCEDLCADVVTQPICGAGAPPAFPQGNLTQVEACVACRTRALPPGYQGDNGTGPATGKAAVGNATAARVLLAQAPSGPSRPPATQHTSPRHATPAPLSEADPERRQSVDLRKARSSAKAAKDHAEVDHAEVLRQGPLSSFGYATIPWASRVHEDAAYYNLADGSCLREWQYGLLIGYGFALVFAVGSVPAGFVCDYKSRVMVTSAALFTWSVATALQAAAHSFRFLLFCRAVMGLAQAFALPATISLTADYFTRRQSLAVAILSVGLYLGSGCASFSILFAEVVGWRWAVYIAGLFGMALAPVVYWTVQEPERTEWSAPCSLAIVREEVLEKSRVAQMLICAGAAKMLAAYSLSAFLPIWYSRRGLIGYTNYRYACWNALIISAGGLLAAVVGAVLGHRWGHRDIRAPCWIGMISSLVSIPLVFGVLQTPHFHISMLCFFLFLLISECWYGPTLTLLQASVRRSVQGQSVSLFLVLTTLTGTLGPALVGFLDPGTERIGLHLLWIATAANVIAAALFMSVAREITVDPVAAGVGSKVHGEPSNGNRICWTVF